MQKYRTLPKDNEFLARNGRLYSILVVGVLLSQVLSALTEAGLIFTIVRDGTSVFGLWASLAMGALGAAVGVAMIEIFGLRIMLPKAVDSFIWSRWSGWDAPLSAFVVLLAGALIVGSFMLSIQGSKQIVNSVTDWKKEATTDSTKVEQSTALATLDSIYTIDRAAIDTQYSDLIAAETLKADAARTVAQQNYEHWKSKGERYKSRINRALVKLQTVEADKATRIAELKTKQADELAALKNRYNRDKDELNSDTKAVLATTIGKTDKTAATFQSGAKWLVIVAMLFSVIGIIILRIVLRGAGVQELATPSNFFFSPTLSSERNKLRSDRQQVAKRNKIAAKRAEIPQLTAYSSNMAVYDIAALQRAVIELKSEADRQTLLLNQNGQLAQGQAVQQLPINSSFQGMQHLSSNNEQHKAKLIVSIIEQAVLQNKLMDKGNTALAGECVEKGRESVGQYLQLLNRSGDVDSFFAYVCEYVEDSTINPNPFDERNPSSLINQLSTTDTTDYEPQITGLVEEQLRLTKSGQSDAAINLTSEVKRLIELYLTRNDSKTTFEEIDAFHSKVIHHLNEPKKYSNPFDSSPTSIGFKQQKTDNSDGQKNGVTNGVVSELKNAVENSAKNGGGMGVRNCDNCGKEYTPKAWNQRFCSGNGKDSCKYKFHAKKHGGTGYDPMYKKRKK